MFMALSAKRKQQAPFGGAESRVVKLYVNSAPSNGVERFCIVNP